MPRVVRIGDPSDHGGEMVSASGHFTVNGKQVCVSGDMHQCPIHGHGTTPVTSTSKTKSNGKSVVRVGDVAGCGAVLIQGSGNVGTV